MRRGVENGAPRGGGHGGTITSRGAPLLPRRPAHRRLLLAARTRCRRRDHWWLRRPPLRRRGWRRQRVGLAVSASAPAAGEAAAPTARIDRRTSRSPCHPSAHPEVTSMAATYCDNLTRSAWVQQVSLQQASAQATRRTYSLQTPGAINRQLDMLHGRQNKVDASVRLISKKVRRCDGVPEYTAKRRGGRRLGRQALRPAPPAPAAHHRATQPSSRGAVSQYHLLRPCNMMAVPGVESLAVPGTWCPYILNKKQT